MKAESIKITNFFRNFVSVNMNIIMASWTISVELAFSFIIPQMLTMIAFYHHLNLILTNFLICNTWISVRVYEKNKTKFNKIG